jgi:hypothetical protein
MNNGGEQREDVVHNKLRGFLLKKIIPKKNSPGIPGHCFGVIRSY